MLGAETLTLRHGVGHPTHPDPGKGVNVPGQQIGQQDLILKN
jgi:hypothetical protein